MDANIPEHLVQRFDAHLLSRLAIANNMSGVQIRACVLQGRGAGFAPHRHFQKLNFRPLIWPLALGDQKVA